MERPAKKIKMDLSKSFEIRVGHSQRCFHVPQDIIRQRSKFFETKYHDGVSKVRLQLPKGVNEAAFDAYLQLLYTGELVLDHDGNSTDIVNKWSELANFYALVRFLQDSASSKLIIDKIAADIMKGELIEAIEGIYTSHHSKEDEFYEVRCLLVHCVIETESHWTLQCYDDVDITRFNTDLAEELLNRYHSGNVSENPFPDGLEKYYPKD